MVALPISALSGVKVRFGKALVTSLLFEVLEHRVEDKNNN
jgi:hypothetical protein